MLDFPDKPGCTTEELRLDVKNSLLPHIRRRTMTATIGTVSTPVAHGLSTTPTCVAVIPHADARVWRAAEADRKFIYLQANTSVAVTIEVSEA